ncbi:hypothetical protein EJ08DRAFT_524978 [Tothia fuscella]|uniref:F-box domain-containing protein n=1 Tax=Tothia fuscella TaxID=1048955 RepID=A0A9P4NH77_9PEZI|nr:hypothetical protein EJ08DRAFT_524978 [Tothia fuscella]
MAEAKGSLGLADLPLEIRLKIYRNLSLAKWISLERQSRMANFQSKVRSPIKLSSPLLRTCKAICRETLPILYGENSFVVRFYSSEAQAKFGRAIGWRARALIRRVKIPEGGGLRTKAMAFLLKSFRNLQTIELLAEAPLASDATNNRITGLEKDLNYKVPSTVFLTELKRLFPHITLEIRITWTTWNKDFEGTTHWV